MLRVNQASGPPSGWREVSFLETVKSGGKAVGSGAVKFNSRHVTYGHQFEMTYRWLNI